MMRGLYAITPDTADTDALLRKVEEALKAGVAMLQYRNKIISKDMRLLQAKELAPLARGYGVPLIVNDDVEVALVVGANGAHLGKEDGDLAAARAKLAGKILGASCYDDLEKARTAVRAGADYVAFGSVFPSPTKPDAARAPLSLFGNDLGVPLCAIGGITLENAPALIAAGASLLAVISDLFDAPDIGARAAEYRKLFQ
ncbi:MAG TPA: thiamine phosphate synthase [Burkholderiales bacterium]|nr:thiamine phosphate synthase [Burkholderiales bacterium]